ncbi:thymidine kinase [Aliagarivorans taiwanensis]|uniref:thymidine kinase n=1 Tax=Aliagarivorans taiwanensis TaxID=561966 RepID=UPI0003F59E7A|nr:thymidine kinase [Aliagarivorans taiwanensis]
MASLHYYYSSMNAGKSSHLLQANFNYIERHMSTYLFTAAIDDRIQKGIISSRIGLSAPAHPFDNGLNLFEVVKEVIAEQGKRLDCILVDESQFLSKEQVEQLCQVVDELNIPVLAYGLRTDFLGELFEGSRWLLAWAERIEEIKGVCFCGRKATMVARVDAQGRAMSAGAQTEIGGEDRYVSVCRKHHRLAVAGELLLKRNLAADAVSSIQAQQLGD